MSYRIAARNTRTKQAIYQQFLDGTHIVDHRQAVLHAEQLARQQTARTQDLWQAEVSVYTPGKKFSLR